LDLARCSKGSIKATATTIVLAQRKSNDFLDHETVVKLEKEAGEACLQTLASFQIQGEVMDDDPGCVWNSI
jgi:uridine phosphorylase